MLGYPPSSTLYCLHPMRILLSLLALLAFKSCVAQLKQGEVQPPLAADEDTVAHAPTTAAPTAEGRVPEHIDMSAPLAMRDLRRAITFGHSNQRIKPDIIVVHSNYHVGDDPFDPDGCVAQFRQYKVAAHYMIERDGTVMWLVDDHLTAYHAGRSQLPGTQRSSLNSCSIGIEMINTTTEGPTAEQYTALVKLVADLRSRHAIKYLMRHSDVSPGRKTDPWCFDWITFCDRVVETSGPLTFIATEGPEPIDPATGAAPASSAGSTTSASR